MWNASLTVYDKLILDFIHLYGIWLEIISVGRVGCVLSTKVC